eukprot:maker-scaffold_25-snap-gene-4.3-mRNA-1 protein AED:0.06 eAED:0.06 QI:402/0.83/1/1/0.5/0.42/7/291/66
MEYKLYFIYWLCSSKREKLYKLSKRTKYSFFNCTRRKYFYELQKNIFPCKKIIKNPAFLIEFYLTY